MGESLPPVAASDAQVYLSAERTMLAWLRTGIAIMAFGFVVARFGLFLRMVREQSNLIDPPSHEYSPYVGSLLVALGVLAIAAGTLEFRRFYRTLPKEHLPRASRPKFAQGICWALVFIGLALAVVLIV